MGESFDTDLKDAFRGRQKGELLAVTLPAPSGIWRAFAGRTETILAREPTVFWAGGDVREGIWVGRGAAHTCSADGISRFSNLEKQLQQLILSIQYYKSNSENVRLFGGGAFFGSEREGRARRALGCASFVLPRVTYVDRGSAASVTIVSDGSDLDALLSFVGPLLSSSEPDTAAGPVHERWEGRVLRDLDGRAAESFRALVRKAQLEIAAGSFDKVVLARRVRAHLGTEFDWTSALARLMAGGQDSVRFAYQSDGGVFLGATPERLVRVRGLDLEADALAGTIPKTERDAPDRLMASGKDRREHEFVVRAIREALEPITDELMIGATPEITELPDLYHLRTPIRARLRKPSPALGLVERLHPTPAVGGFPREAALRFIEENEPDPRGWYAGPFGWVDSKGDGEFVVALRSAYVEGEEAELFAGAGIVLGSDPDAEFAETELKLGRMLAALGVERGGRERDRAAAGRSAEPPRQGRAVERT